jgi:hypothetical protein
MRMSDPEREMLASQITSIGRVGATVPGAQGTQLGGPPDPRGSYSSISGLAPGRSGLVRAAKENKYG